MFWTMIKSKDLLYPLWIETGISTRRFLHSFYFTWSIPMATFWRTCITNVNLSFSFPGIAGFFVRMNPRKSVWILTADIYIYILFVCVKQRRSQVRKVNTRIKSHDMILQPGRKCRHLKNGKIEIGFFFHMFYLVFPSVDITTESNNLLEILGTYGALIMRSEYFGYYFLKYC